MVVQHCILEVGISSTFIESLSKGCKCKLAYKAEWSKTITECDNANKVPMRLQSRDLYKYVIQDNITWVICGLSTAAIKIRWVYCSYYSPFYKDHKNTIMSLLIIEK